MRVYGYVKKNAVNSHVHRCCMRLYNQIMHNSMWGIVHLLVTNYRELCECGEDAKAMAMSTFIAHKQSYHMVAAKKISKILQLD